jgi:Cu2+-exporting ATPase
LDQGIKTGLALLFAIPVVTFAWGHDLIDKKTKAIVSVALATLVQIIAIPEFYQPALSTLFYSKMVEMDMLVVISITAAYIYSIVAFGFQMAGRPLGTSEFFETSTLLITFILFGRAISTFARVKATDSVSIRSSQSSTAVLAEEGGHDREIDARLLQYGDQFRLLPHSRVPTDGTIVQGKTEIDESMLTGEAMPVLKRVGDGVIAGTVNGDGTVLVQLDRLPGKNTVTDIAKLVDQAADKKPKIQDLADKVAGWFVPVVSTVSLIVLVVWIAVGLKVLNYSTSTAVLEAITYFVAALAVACPCALGLAVPMVSIVAGGIAARGGVIIKSAETTERARTATDVIFDKTGTITESELAVVEEKYISDDKDMAISLTKALVAGGKHPVSAAISKYLSDNSKGNPMDVSDIRVVPGAGILANLDGRILRAGHPRWTGTDLHPAVESLEAEGRTILVVTLDSSPLIAFGLKTQIRPEAARIIAELKARNIRVHLVSGDHTKAVQSVARAVSIPEENTAAERLPSEKQDYVASIMEDPSRYVIFCGDGTNDAGAVAEAHVGVQINGSLTGSDVTQNASDVILLNGLEGVVTLINVSQAAFNRMVFNFVWSAIYNVLAITLASGAWVRFRIPPAYAGLAELVSVLPVIAAAVTMFLVDLKHKTDATRVSAQ